MERIVVLIQSNSIDRQLIDFACYLSELTGSMLTGLFLNPSQTTEAAELALPGTPMVGQVIVPRRVQIEHTVDKTTEVKKQFIKSCDNKSLARRPDIIDAYTMEDVLLESRFADLFIVSADVSWSETAESVPTGTVEDILRKAECPVIVAPLSFGGVEEIVFAYDGSASAVYAIKQFTHLFPQLQDQKVTFLEVNDDSNMNIEYQEKIIAYLKMHYSAIGYKTLTGQPESELFAYLLGKKNVVIVMGAFGKKLIPSLFQHSTANLLLKTTSVPLFIAHR